MHEKVQRSCLAYFWTVLQFFLRAAAFLRFNQFFSGSKTLFLRCLGSPLLLRSSGSHQRSILFPLGNKNYQFVSVGNCLAARVALLAMFSMAFCSVFLLEQPQNSQAENHPRLQELFDRFQIFRCGIWGANYANDNNCSAKRHWLYSNSAMFLQRLSHLAGHLPGEKREQLTVNLVKRQKRSDGSWNWTGDRDILKASQCLVC